MATPRQAPGNFLGNGLEIVRNHSINHGLKIANFQKINL